MSVDTPLLVRQLLLAGGIPAEVRTRLGSNQQPPIVRLEDAGGAFVRSDRPDWLTVDDVQLDVWAATRAAADELERQCSSVLLAAPRTNPNQPAGVVTRVDVGGRQWLPDVDWRTTADHPMPRFVTVVRIVAHPPTSA